MVANPIIYSMSALFLVVLTATVYFMIFFMIFFVIAWGITRLFKPIFKLLRYGEPY